MKTLLGRWTETALDEMLKAAQGISSVGERIAFISEKFLDAPYQEGTLIGSRDLPEELVLNLAAVDCFTFLDYVEAFRLSSSYAEVLRQLREVRYDCGEVAYSRRNHFFTDWIVRRKSRVTDVTQTIAGSRGKTARKILNRKQDGSPWLDGIGAAERDLLYIPGNSCDAATFEGLRTGDYAGIYSAESGLDVSHVGIAIRTPQGLMLRHASSAQSVRRVVDQDLQEYISSTPGMIVLRPRG